MTTHTQLNNVQKASSEDTNYSVMNALSVSVRFTMVVFLLCGGVYTSIATGLGSILFPHQASGSLLTVGSKTVGSELVSQKFESSQYFHSRPSAAGYDPRGTVGSNLAPDNPELKTRVASQVDIITQEYNIDSTVIPVDMVTTSGSGLDPHISPEAAYIQAKRIAMERNIELDRVKRLITTMTEQPQWGVFGQERVNVLLLNIELDKIDN
ncbi:potassium-transporting ATPase subunit C [Salinivibrio sp. MA351]|nr:potassium-transporting ATPase subunit C [Salinivibrio sp. MA351]